MSALPYILSSQAIDKTAWDNCITRSKNYLIYGTAAYLDALCEWEALVWGDYEAVMPLPYRKKWGIKYYYTPSFIQQLGIFINAEAALPEFKDISKSLANIQFADINFNYLNQTLLNNVSGKKEKINQVLFLGAGYEKIAAHYSKDLNRNLKQAKSYGLIVQNSNNIELAINTYQSLYASRMPQVKSVDYANFTNLCKLLAQEKKCFVKEVYDTDKQLMACGIFLFDGKRIYNIASSTLPAGRQKSANHFLLDTLIKANADQQIIFDFEGSDLAGVQQFYQQFGAVYQNYSICRINQLPSVIRWLKPRF